MMAQEEAGQAGVGAGSLAVATVVGMEGGPAQIKPWGPPGLARKEGVCGCGLRLAVGVGVGVSWGRAGGGVRGTGMKEGVAGAVTAAVEWALKGLLLQQLLLPQPSPLLLLLLLRVWHPLALGRWRWTGEGRRASRSMHASRGTRDHQPHATSCSGDCALALMLESDIR